MRHILVMLLVVSAQTPAPQPAPAVPAQPPACSSPKYSELDFWLGEWDARGANAPADRPPNSSVITKVHGGCVILETWKSPNYSGQSFNIYDRTRGQWHQTWVDSGGGLQEFWGRVERRQHGLRGDRTTGERADRRRTDADDVLQSCARQSTPARRALIGWRKDLEGPGTTSPTREGRYPLPLRLNDAKHLDLLVRPFHAAQADVIDDAVVVLVFFFDLVERIGAELEAVVAARHARHLDVLVGDIPVVDV